MKLSQMRYFQAVCLYGNTTRAADSLFVSQPSISMAIKELEEELHVKLFVRQNNRMMLTREGSFFLERVNRVLDEVRTLEQTMQHLNSSSTVTLSLPAGTLLDTVKLGSSVLERGKDYNYNATSGTVTFLRETLAKKSKGSYTITFVPTRGSSSSCSLTVTDSAPVNEVAPSSVDFDANTSSGGYQDVSVTLNPADGATLKNIRAGGKTLEENWQYKVDGSTVTLSKTAVAQFGKDGATYADFTFVMSKGQSPTLRVNYVTTYALTANVVDDLGLPISGATVTFTPNDAESGTAAQTLVTDSDGKATVYVKRGSYTLTATHERFTSAITQTTSVSSGRTVKMTGEILETVQLVVTNEYGAPLSGAAVSTDLPPGAMTAEAATGIHNEKTATESDISVTVFSQLCCCAQF